MLSLLHTSYNKEIDLPGSYKPPSRQLSSSNTDPWCINFYCKRKIMYYFLPFLLLTKSISTWIKYVQNLADQPGLSNLPSPAHLAPSVEFSCFSLTIFFYKSLVFSVQYAILPKLHLMTWPGPSTRTHTCRGRQV